MAHTFLEQAYIIFHLLQAQLPQVNRPLNLSLIQFGWFESPPPGDRPFRSQGLGTPANSGLVPGSGQVDMGQRAEDLVPLFR